MMTECYECAKLAELMAENNALRAANDMKATESDARTLGVDANDASVDTREKLEADANGYVMSWWQSDWVDSFDHADSMKRDIMRLLDRQAAITERHILTHPDERDEQIAELQREVDRLTRENISLARDLGECMAERDELREKLSAALGNAHETLALVDMDGNVVS